MENETQKNLRHNYIVNLLDGGFFGMALGFASFSTIIPLFVSNLTSSALLIGLIPAVHNTGWQLPQLFTARQLSKLTRFKPFVMFMTTFERSPFLGIGIIALFLPVLSKELALGLTFFMLILQGLGGGLTANAWQLLVNKIIPPDYLATFFGFQSSAANLLSSGGAIIAGYLLENLRPPFDFASCFFIASLFFFVSWFFLNATREPHHTVHVTEFSSLPFLQSIRLILKKDRPFRWYLLARNLFQFGTMAFAFYTVYAVRIHGISEVAIGLLTSVLFVTSVVANPVLGWLADHWNKRYVMEIGAGAALLSALIAWLVPDLSLFFLVFGLAGIANTVFWTAGMVFTMSFGTDEEKPTYIGLANTLIAPSAILAPLIGGLLADLGGYQLTFLVATIASAITILILHFFVSDAQR
jgi:MFS family permease